MATKKTFCSICSAFCGFEAEIENNSILKFTPDKDHPMSQGFSCSKGRAFPQLLNSKNRYTQCLKRNTSGDMQPVEKGAALDTIAAQLTDIVETHGAQAVGLYYGNGVSFKSFTTPAISAWMQGLGSHKLFSTMTIDQPAKLVATGRHGLWAAGGHTFESADVAMLLGNNPMVSGLHMPGGPAGWRPAVIKEARKRGLKLIVVDPRRCETAQQADLYLPIKPGTDAFLLAAMINTIVARNLHDAEFIQLHTQDFDALMQRLQMFTLDVASNITGLEVNAISEACDLFAGQIDERSKRGQATSGTGPDMGANGNITEHLLKCLNAICGRYNRVGDRVSGSLMTPNMAPMAAVVPFDFMPAVLNPAANTLRSRVADAHQVYLQMPGSTLADEILQPGEGQLKALIIVGGNPVMSMPNGKRMQEALAQVDLLVVIETRETDSCVHADYILPATYGLEREEMTLYNDFLWNAPFHQYSDKVVNAPADASEEWLYLAELAKRMNIKMPLAGGELNVETPSLSNLMDCLHADGATKIPVRELCEHEGGKIFEQYAALEVREGFEGMDDKLQLMPTGVNTEFDELLNPPAILAREADQDFLLICRRNKHVYNSMCHEVGSGANTDNPAYMHPDDIAALGAQEGQQINLRSSYGSICAVLKKDTTLRRGVVSSSHSFGSQVNAENQARFASVSNLLDCAYSNDPHARMPIMSAVPIAVELNQ